MNPFLPDDQKVAAIRALLPATGAGIYLDTATAGPLPAETDRALREADDWELRVGRGGPDHAADADVRRREAAAVVAAALGVGPDRVLLGTGVRGVLAAVLAAMPGDARSLELAAGLAPEVADGARAIAAGLGWSVSPLGEASTGVVLAPAIGADDGVPIDLRALATQVHAADGLLLADLTLAAGATDLALAATGADAAILATDRWLLCPDGTAACWLAPALGAEPMALATRLVDPLPRRTALGVARSVGWLLMYVGLPWAVVRTTAMAHHLGVAIAATPGVELLTPPDAASPTRHFRIRGWTVDEAADELGARVFAILGRDTSAGALRVGVGAWTMETELDRFAAAVAELAAHTPDSLPRRPSLVVLGNG